MAIVQVSTPSYPILPCPYRFSVKNSIPKDAIRITRFVTDLWLPSISLNFFCIPASPSDLFCISSARFAPCWYWIVSSRPRRESSTKLFSLPNSVRNFIPLPPPLLPFQNGITTPTTRYAASANTPAAGGSPAV